MHADRRNKRYVIQPEVKKWTAATAVVGGSVRAQAAKAVSIFVKTCRIDGLWIKMSASVIFPFASDNFTGVFIPLVAPATATFTSNNFDSGDYSMATGLDPGANNSTKWINTNIAANTIFSSSSAQASVYHRLLRGQTSTLLAANGDSTTSIVAFWPDYQGTDYFQAFNDTNSVVLAGSVAGLTTGRRSNVISAFRNGVLVANSSTLGGTLPTQTIGLFRTSMLTGDYYRNVCSYIYFGQALTNSEEMAHYMRVQQLQASLMRAV